MAAPVLRVLDASKKHSHQLRRSLAYAVRDVGRELLPPGPARLRPGEFWAVDDVSFDLEAGEAIAVIGRNGAGKSTLLKLLAGLLKPDRGEILIEGTSEAILALGGGLQPTLSGRENIELGAAIHGLFSRDRQRLVDDTVDFAELREFIDDPVQSYSAGMKARLAYAISANLRPGLLLVDEALAVGDLNFQRKCIKHMQTYVREGGALVLVSHSAYHIQPVCGRGILLEKGRAVFAGSAADALAEMHASRSDGDDSGNAAGDAAGPAAIESVQVDAVGGDGIVRTGEPVRLTVQYRLDRPLDALWSISIWTGDGMVCVTAVLNETPRRLPAGRGELSCLIRDLPLVAGQYRIRSAILDAADVMEVAQFGVEGRGLLLDVQGAPGRFANLQAQVGQLVKVDGEWE
jgi:ABC-type polysaccharide/polyol phosphate transport system ATPase subunit